MLLLYIVRIALKQLLFSGMTLLHMLNWIGICTYMRRVLYINKVSFLNSTLLCSCFTLENSCCVSSVVCFTEGRVLQLGGTTTTTSLTFYLTKNSFRHFGSILSSNKTKFCIHNHTCILWLHVAQNTEKL